MSRRRKAQVLSVLSAAATLAAGSAAHAATLAVGADGTAVFQAAPGETNVVRAVMRFGVVQLTVSDAGAPLTAGAGCQQLDANTATCPEPESGKRPVVFLLGDGNDTAVVDDNFFRLVSASGEAGNDSVQVGSGTGTPAVLDGGTGHDQLTTYMNGEGPPTLRGGAGNDVLAMRENGGGRAFGGDGADRLQFEALALPSSPIVLDAGGGDDVYSFGFHFRANAMTPGPGIDTLDQRTSLRGLDFEMAACSGCVERVFGSPFDDRIVGDGLAQAIVGDDGADLIDGGGGKDDLAGSGGDDTILARDGATDGVSCGAGTDAVTADGRDRITRDCESIARGR